MLQFPQHHAGQRTPPQLSAPASHRVVVDILGLMLLASFSLWVWIAPAFAVRPPSTATATIQPTATSTPAPNTPTAASGNPTQSATDYTADGNSCVPTDRIAIQVVRDVKINSYCEVTEWQQQKVAMYVEDALDLVPPDVHPTLEVFVLSDRKAAARVQFDWLRIHGQPDVVYGELLRNWEDADGKANPEAVYIYLDQHDPWSGTSAGIGEVVLHEMHHIVQFTMVGAYDMPPDWFSEGGANYFTYSALYHRSSGAPGVHDAEVGECHYSLGSLREQQAAIPDLCRYLEGERAVALLVYNFGVEKYYGVLRSLGAGQPFEAAFTEGYGISLPVFYQRFDDYRKGAYRLMPQLATPVPAAVP